MDFVIFLDVDGVLNSSTSCVSTPSKKYKGVEPKRVELLAKAMELTGAGGVVLTSTWKDMREDDEDYIYLVESLLKDGIQVVGKTKEECFQRRGTGIIRYLQEHPEVEEYVILDDHHFDFHVDRKLWENFLDTREKGIEYSVCASETPSVAAMLFLDAIQRCS